MANALRRGLSVSECYNNTCDESAYFRCNYGGCILDQLTCNGESDCLDGSDENKYLCADDNQLDSLLMNNAVSAGELVKDMLKLEYAWAWNSFIRYF